MNQKRVKTSWSECVRCGVILSDRDLSKHDQYCLLKSTTGTPMKDESLNESISSSSTPKPYGYIHDDVLYTCVSTLKTSELDCKLPDSIKETVAYLSPSTMRLCKIPISQEICLNNSVILKCWPHSSVQDAHVVIPSNNSVYIDADQWRNQLCQIERVPYIQEAERVRIRLTESDSYKNINTEHLTQFISANIIGRAVSIGSKLAVKFFGRSISFIITDIKQKTTPNTDLLDVTNNLRSISIESEEKALNSTSTPTQTPNKHQTPQNPNKLQTPYKTPLTEQLHANIKLVDNVDRFSRVVSSTHILLSRDDNSADNETCESTNEEEKIFRPAGYDDLLNKLKQLIEEPITSKTLYQQYGIRVSRGALLYGPSGSGKTTLSRYMEHELKDVCSFIQLDTGQLWTKQFGESETRLKKYFEQAVSRSPSVLLIDDIDVICPRKERSQSDLEKRILSSLITEIDTLNHMRDAFVFILATTNKIDSVDVSLRRPGRLDRELEMSVPTMKQRTQIIGSLLLPVLNNLTDTQITEISSDCHGYVAADLQHLIREASLLALHGKSVHGVTADHIKQAMSIVQPSAMREVFIDVPKVKWTDIGGQHDLKQKLIQAIEWPLKHADKFKRLGITPPRGVLMYGPPGCSKTMIAKALATETSLNFISIKGPELFSKWVGESEKAVREVFRKARSAAPSIVFFDEIDAVAVERGRQSSSGGGVGDRVLAQILTELDGVEGLCDVSIVAATNRPDMIDKALTRPGRLDRIVYVPLPDSTTRLEIFKLRLRNVPLNDDDVKLEKLVELTNGYSGAEVTAVCNEAAIASLQDNIDTEQIEWTHFLSALETVKPQTTQQQINYYNEYHNKFKSKTVYKATQ